MTYYKVVRDIKRMELLGDERTLFEMSDRIAGDVKRRRGGSGFGEGMGFEAAHALCRFLAGVEWKNSNGATMRGLGLTDDEIMAALDGLPEWSYRNASRKVTR